MKFRTSLLLLLTALAATVVHAGELSPEVEAKFLKAIVSSSGSTKIACSDPVLKAALEAQGLTVDASAMIVWATTSNEARAGKTMGRLVVTNKREFSANACVVLEEADGRPKLLLNTPNLHTAKVQLGDAMLKIAGVI